MGILKNIIDKIFRGGASTGAAKTSTTVSTADASSYYYDLYAPAPMGLKIATVFRCVQVLSDAVAQMPLLYQRRSGGIYVPATDDPLYYLLTQEADRYTTAFDMKSQAVVQMLLDGNAYIVPQISGMGYESLVLCSRGTVQHDTYNDIYTVNDPLKGISGEYSEDEIIHLKGMCRNNPKHGVSVLQYASDTLSIASAGDSETLKQMLNGGNVRGILKNAMTGKGLDLYDDQELEKLGNKMREQLNGNRSIIVTPGETDFVQMSMTAADMQFLESRKFAVRDICRFFGVHPSFVFDDTSNNYKSAEMANVAFLSNTLNPLLRKIESELQRKLVGRNVRRRIEFDRSGIYALDLDSRVRYYTQMIAAGAYSVNDVRALENMPPVEGGDRIYISANLKGIDETNTKTPDNEGN